VSFMDRIEANPLPLFKLLVLPMGLVVFTAMAIEGASARDKGCNGDPVPGRIKLDCCGEADEHQLKPEQISRGPNDEYIVSFEGYTFVIPADKALPSNDPCSHIFFPNMWVETDDGNQVRDPSTPNIRCFLTPLDFCPRTRAPSLSEADPRSSSARHRS
jgi:hypothetical protein